VPRLSPQQRELLDLIDGIAATPEFHLDMDFEAGDIQLLKNSVILHARTEYEDFPEPERKRHLLRLWLTAHSGFADGDAFLQQGIPKKPGVDSDAGDAQPRV
jgi:alpha-ketoglutarate-dependent taurine dioxygenase